MNPDDEKTLLEQFVSEHAKRARHVSEAAERKAAMNLIRNLSQFEWYQQQCTPAARKAHEREILNAMEAYQSSQVRNCD